jgi:hypothetical protein
MQEQDVIKVRENQEQQDSRGFCLIQPDEIVEVNGLKLKVIKFDKKDLTLEFLSENVDEVQKGKEVKIKAGTFIVNSFGKKFAMLRTKAATTIYDQRVLDEINKQKILKMRKET